MKIYINSWYCDQKSTRDFLKRPVTYLIIDDKFVEFVGKEIPEMGITIDKQVKSTTGYWPYEEWRLSSYVLIVPQGTQTVYLYTDPITKLWEEQPKSMNEALSHRTFHHIRLETAAAIFRHQFPELAEELSSA